jgi:predicted Zn-dependent protease
MTKLRIIITITLLLLLSTKIVFATSLIRDTETESYLREIATPIFKAANLDPNKIKIHIVNNSNINAFVTANMNMFINTGTITLDNTASGLIGVISHETGHIAAGHISKLNQEIDQMKINLALSYILGIATAISGNVDAGQAIILGGSHASQRSLYSYSRLHESAADNLAIKYLDKTKQSSEGLLNFFKKINSNEMLILNNDNPYTRTHPLTKDRISHINNHLKKSKYRNNLPPSKLNEKHLLIKTKLNAFLKDPEKILKKHNSNSFLDQYGAAIALHRLGKSNQAILILNNLIKTKKENIFIKELKAQMLYENGQNSQAIKLLIPINKEIKDSALIKIELALAYLNSKNKTSAQKAINLLNQALNIEKDNIFAWKQLAIAYGRNKQIDQANLAIAETSLRKEQYRRALKFANKVNNSNASAATKNRSKDIINRAKEKLKRR